MFARSPHTKLPWRACAAALLLLALTAAASAGPQGDDALELRFSGFFQMPVGPRGLAINPALRDADGRKVRIVGYMVQQEQPLPGHFLLTPRPVQLSEQADGDADDLPPATVTVLLDPAQRDRVVVHQPGLLELTGRLHVGREAVAGRVSWFRLQLEPEALVAAESAPAPGRHP